MERGSKKATILFGISLRMNDIDTSGTFLLDRRDDRVAKSAIGVQKCNRMEVELGTSHHK